MAVALLLLSGCGDLDNNSLRKGDVQGRVLRADRSFGRVVLMGTDPIRTGLDNDGSFHIHSIDSGQYELLIVASSTEALRVPVTVGGGDLTDLQDVDPLPAAFVTINLTSSSVPECFVKVGLTDLDEIHAPDGTAQFVAGPLGAAPQGPGCYDISMEHNGLQFWRQENLCLDAGQQETYDVSW